MAFYSVTARTRAFCPKVLRLAFKSFCFLRIVATSSSATARAFSALGYFEAYTWAYTTSIDKPSPITMLNLYKGPALAAPSYR